MARLLRNNVDQAAIKVHMSGAGQAVVILSFVIFIAVAAHFLVLAIFFIVMDKFVEISDREHSRGLRKPRELARTQD